MSRDMNYLDRTKVPWLLIGVALGQFPWLFTRYHLTALFVTWAVLAVVLAYEAGRKYA
jgi:hypothetical protein